MKIIFLDIDGVLVNRESFRMTRTKFERLDSFVDGITGKRLTYARLIA